MRCLGAILVANWAAVCFVLAVDVESVRAQGQAGHQPPAQVEDVAQARLAATQRDTLPRAIHLEGTVLWVDVAAGRLVLQDESGTEELELDWGGTPVTAGHRVRVQGEGLVTASGSGIRLGSCGPVVNNDGVHGVISKSGSIYLAAGRQPLRVEWFNALAGSVLEVWYSGPETTLQRIPAGALWREETNSSTPPRWVNGVNYRTVDVPGEALPRFELAVPVAVGSSPNFDPSVAGRDEHVGVQFDGFLDVPRSGVYTFELRSDDGSRLYVGAPAFRMAVYETVAFPRPVPFAAGQILQPGEDRVWAVVEGVVHLVSATGNGMRLELGEGTTRVRVEVADRRGLTADSLLRRSIKVTGFCQAAMTLAGQRVPGILLTPGAAQIQVLAASEEPVVTAPPDTTVLPTLRTAARVHRLKREEAERGYPVILRGTVTSVLPEHQAVTLQDATRGIYVVDASSNGTYTPQIGEYLEIEGATDPSYFAPIVNARRMSRLGPGQLPSSVIPTWEQLLTGSLDAQFVEISGVVTAVHSNSISLFMREGVVEVELRVIGPEPSDLSQFENALVRVRGCLFASWDYQTHQFRPGTVRIYGADVLVDQPAPSDLFAIPPKSAAELRMFDPQAGLFRRVKVASQVTHVSGRHLFLEDRGTGVRCELKSDSTAVMPGDLVEVVGFPDVSGPAAPVLREALLRRQGRMPLPVPADLSAAEGNGLEFDATRVRLKGVLVDRRRTESGWLLEIQSGVRSFAARCELREEPPNVAIGSRLELTGVYAVLGTQQVAGHPGGSFELLLDSAREIRVLARPPWWTLERLLLIVGMLAAVLVLAMLWINQLHRQVEQRGIALEKEIRARQHVEQQRLLDQERARVAQDLHDELGSDLTEVSMLLARAQSSTTSSERRSGYLEQTRLKARQMVTALDEIVWAMNPRHDSLGSLTSYFCLHADRFLGLAGIAWRLVEVAGAPDVAVDSRRRHQLFLAFKEALTNVVRHARASEVRFSLSVQSGEVQLQVQDNGRGLPDAAPDEGMDGVGNLRSRCEKLGGHFEIYGAPGGGTIVRFRVPVN